MMKQLWVYASLWTLAMLIRPSLAASAEKQHPLPLKTGETFIVDDFDNKTTRKQMGANYFGGNNGVTESAQGLVELGWSPESAVPDTIGSLKFTYDFSMQPVTDGVFGGLFLSQFGLTDTLVNLDGSGIQPPSSTEFPGYAFNTTDVFSPCRSHLPQSRRSVEVFTFHATNLGDRPVKIKVEIKDEDGNAISAYCPINPGPWKQYRLHFPHEFIFSHRVNPAAKFDPTRVSLVSFLVEAEHVVNKIKNPVSASLLLDSIGWIDVDGKYPDLHRAHQNQQQFERAFLEHVRESSFRYFVDFASTDPRTGGMIQDRSTFADLMSIGGVGFQLTAYCLGVERHYIRREVGRTRTLELLRALHDKPQGPQRVGTLGYRGFFYHFAGIDGLRKHNFDFVAAPQLKANMNTIELSPIDTALALAGIITCRQYFSGQNPQERQIVEYADAILDRVDWRFMLEPGSNQWYLGWKPNEQRLDEGKFGRFQIADDKMIGAYSSKPDQGIEVPATIDYYTDEGLLISLLARASTNPQHRVGIKPFFSAHRQGEPFTKTYPGALFTYQFASCWLNTRRLGADKDPAGVARRINYFDNSREATLACIEYCRQNPNQRTTLNALRFALSACDGVYDEYHADSAPTVALGTEGGCHDANATFRQRPLEVGTVTVYGAGSSILHCPQEAIAGLWEAQRLGLLHPRFGFCDAFNLNIAQSVTPCIDPKSPEILRTTGRWANFTGYAIDHGPMMILLDNHLEDQFIPSLFMSYPPIRNALKEIYPESTF